MRGQPAVIGGKYAIFVGRVVWEVVLVCGVLFERGSAAVCGRADGRRSFSNSLLGRPQSHLVGRG